MDSQADEEGCQCNILTELIDHRKNADALSPDDSHVTVRGKQHPKRTTKGWQLCVQWRDGSTSWEDLKNLKEANSIETAEYTVAHSLTSKPAFSWWAPYTLKKRDHIITAVWARFVRKDVKFGIKVPNTIAEARRMDKDNGDTYWEKSVKKEMKNVRVTFKILDNEQTSLLATYKYPAA
jgi:hypothetical protein